MKLLIALSNKIIKSPLTPLFSKRGKNKEGLGRISWLSLTLLILLGVIWGSGYSIARYCVTHGVAPIGYSFWQSIGPALFLIIASSFSQHKISFNPVYIRYYLVCGILGIAFPNTLMYFTAEHLPAGVLAVLSNTVPIFTYPLAILSMQEKFKLSRLLAVMIGVVGIMLIVWPKDHQINTDHWTLLVLLVPISFACCAVFISAFRPVPSNSFSLSAGMMVVSTLCLLPFISHYHEFHPLNWPFSRVDWLILLEIVLSSIGYVIFFALIKRAGPVYYSLVGGVVSLTGLFWGYIVFAEKLTLLLGLAVIAILSAIIMLSVQRNS